MSSGSKKKDILVRLTLRRRPPRGRDPRTVIALDPGMSWEAGSIYTNGGGTLIAHNSTTERLYLTAD
jgi:hypothetical protein